MIRWLVIAVALFAMGCASKHSSVASKSAPLLGLQPIRGVWIPAPHHTSFFDSPATIEAHLTELESAGINTIFVVMWNQGRTFYPSRVMKDFTGVEIDERLHGRDPLKEIMAAAKPKKMKVFAWFEFGFATDIHNGKGREILQKKPHWAARTHDGKQVIRNGIRWMNAFDPEVQDFMLSLWMEVAAYGLDGIQGDDRLPALPVEGGYEPGTIVRYQREHAGNLPPQNSRDPAWIQWRANILNDYMARIFRETRKAHPQLIVSMAPSVYPWCRDEFLQDWPVWVKNGWVDLVTPQVYRRDVPAYTAIIREMTEKHLPTEKRAMVFPGILLRLSDGYQADAELVRGMVEANRRAGLAGEVYFYNEGVRKLLPLMRTLYLPTQ